MVGQYDIIFYKKLRQITRRSILFIKLMYNPYEKTFYVQNKNVCFFVALTRLKWNPFIQTIYSILSSLDFRQNIFILTPPPLHKYLGGGGSNILPLFLVLCPFHSQENRNSTFSLEYFTKILFSLFQNILHFKQNRLRP